MHNRSKKGTWVLSRNEKHTLWHSRPPRFVIHQNSLGFGKWFLHDYYARPSMLWPHLSPLCMIMKSGPTHITMSHYFCTLKWPLGTHPTWLLYWEFCPTKGQNLLLILSYQPIIHTYIYINQSYSSMAMVNWITQSTHTWNHASNARCLNHKNDTNKQKK